MSKDKKSDIRVVRVPLAEIKPYWRNPRHNDAAVDAVVQSIESYGFNVPIVLDQKRTIIAGHTRWKALQKMGREFADCIISTMSDDEAREYRIADNKTSELSTWNWDHLMPELREITDLSQMQTFFPDMDLKVFLSDDGGEGPSQDQIDTAEREAAEARSAGATGERSAAAQDEHVDVTCPHCGEDFTLDRIEFERRLGHNKGDGDGDGAEAR